MITTLDVSLVVDPDLHGEHCLIDPAHHAAAGRIDFVQMTRLDTAAKIVEPLQHPFTPCLKHSGSVLLIDTLFPAAHLRSEVFDRLLAGTEHLLSLEHRPHNVAKLFTAGILRLHAPAFPLRNILVQLTLPTWAWAARLWIACQCCFWVAQAHPSSREAWSSQSCPLREKL